MSSAPAVIGALRVNAQLRISKCYFDIRILIFGIRTVFLCYNGQKPKK